ncbi:MAG: hypothetical protein IPK53_01530 [bacterium]|nr:hypothetical protein [bacterium]
MKGYVVLFLLPLPKKNLAEYKKLARRFGRWRWIMARCTIASSLARI